jgi:hypothetical protein
LLLGMLDDDSVLNVETIRPATRSPDDRAAVKYLEVSGATAISVVIKNEGCAFRVGIDPRAVTVQWLPETNTRAVVRLARKHAGKNPDVATAQAALAQAAADLKLTLTPHATAMTRAGAAAERLDAYVASLRSRGGMKEFTREYKRRRIAATMRGEGFMSYPNAQLRFKRALILLLMGGGQPAIGQLFSEIFGR